MYHAHSALTGRGYIENTKRDQEIKKKTNKLTRRFLFCTRKKEKQRRTYPNERTKTCERTNQKEVNGRSPGTWRLSEMSVP
jgi:hypothetical protein